MPRGGSSWPCKAVVMLFCPTSFDGCGSEQLLDSSCETGPGHSSVLPVILSQVPVSGLVWAGRDLQCPDSLGLGVLFFLQAYHSSLWKEMNFSDNPEKSSGCSYPKLGCSTVPVSQAIQLILTLWGCPVPLFALLVLLWPTSHLQLHAFACPLVSLAHCVPLT